MYQVRGLDIIRDVDYVLAPLCVVLACGIVALVYFSRYRNTLFGQLFVIGFALKVVFLGLRLLISLTSFAEDADTYKYYQGSHGIYEAFQESPLLAAEILVRSPENYSMRAKDYAFRWLNRTSTGTVIRVAGFIGIFTFDSYVTISIIFGLLAFVGCVLIFETLHRYYPGAVVYLAIACLFVPSVVFWSNLISKDALAILGLGMVTYYGSALTSRQRRGILQFIGFAIGAYLLFLVKSYILMAFIASAIVPLLFMSKLPFAERGVRIFFRGMIATIMVLGAGLLLMQIGSAHEKYSSEGIAEMTENLEGQKEFGGSSYSVSMFNLSPSGIVLGSVQAMWISMFRPTILEANRVILLPSAVENLLLFLATIFVFLRVGVIRSVRYITSDPILVFCLVFTCLFAIISGLYSWNFGALVRYRMPYVPFYVSLLGILYYTWSKQSASYRLNALTQ